MNVHFVLWAGLTKTTEGGGASDGENLVLFAVAGLDGGVMVFEPLANFWRENNSQHSVLQVASFVALTGSLGSLFIYK